uniref:NADH dehydrogenase subunit 6 n=1 Tax=Cazira verrucosa TaxID=3101551 RepID=UPI002E7A9048|nr:NADH dehydrogenase subunit 6 [Cazira verrucosa]WPO01460.1 NADH dehydrogenase subunit 6 [Cazira verrucosa]
MNFLLSFMFLISLILLTLNHPLSMGLILILQTIITAMLIGYMLKSFFFSYIITIIILSGALVLFIYMASVASNEKFKYNIKFNAIFLMTLIMMSILLNSNYEYLIDSIPNNDNINYIKIFNMITAQLTMIMIIYLLFTMIVVSNIAKINKGPLRMMN